jgi:hypothetical protein
MLHVSIRDKRTRAQGHEPQSDEPAPAGAVTLGAAARSLGLEIGARPPLAPAPLE